MPTVETPDETTLYWEEAGEGPLVVVANQLFADRGVTEGLVNELAADHRVLTYDPRGTGKSTRPGPYDIRTDAGDLLALIGAAGGGPVAMIGLGNGCESAAIASAKKPGAVSGVVVPFGNPVALRAASKGSEALVGSGSVLEALREMLATDYRAGLRTVVDSGNPQMGEDEIRARVDSQEQYCPAEVALARLDSWINDPALDEARALGDRLWLLQHPHNPWFPADLVESTRQLLPDAHIEEVEDGHLSRPDITAGYIRRITAAT